MILGDKTLLSAEIVDLLISSMNLSVLQNLLLNAYV